MVNLKTVGLSGAIRNSGWHFFLLNSSIFEKKQMQVLNRLKWPLVIFCAGLILENFSMIAKSETFAENIYLAGLWIKIIGLIGLVGKLIFAENK